MSSCLQSMTLLWGRSSSVNVTQGSMATPPGLTLTTPVIIADGHVKSSKLFNGQNCSMFYVTSFTRTDIILQRNTI